MKTITVKNIDGTETDFVIIDRGNGEFTSMPKSVYDEQQEQLTESSLGNTFPSNSADPVATPATPEAELQASTDSTTK